VLGQCLDLCQNIYGLEYICCLLQNQLLVALVLQLEDELLGKDPCADLVAVLPLVVEPELEPLVDELQRLMLGGLVLADGCHPRTLPLVSASKEKVIASEAVRPQAMHAESVLGDEGLVHRLSRCPAAHSIEAEAVLVFEALAACSL
jgi:hypothetical protein